jgi:hypothetical protein
VGVPSFERVGVLVIRAWTAGTPPEPALRARLTSTLDLDSPRRKVSAAASAEEILELVRDWLEGFQGEAQPGGERGARSA